MTQLATPKTESQHPPVREVDRIEAPSREEFERDYVLRNRPVVLTGVADKWPAFSKWNAEYLESVAGDALVSVHFEERGDFQRWYTPTGQVDRKMPLREFLAILTADEPDRRYYMTEHDLSLVSRELIADVDASRYTDPGSEPRLFLGRDTCMPLHYHSTTEAILCQLVGSKEVLLYSPEQFPLLYAHPWHSNERMFSRIDGRLQVKAFTRDVSYLRLDDPDPDSFPKFQQAQPHIIKLEPGEILFIPVQWWHLTTCPGFQINVSFFWRSHRSRYTFPQPGLQVCAYEFLRSVKKKLGRGPAHR